MFYSKLKNIHTANYNNLRFNAVLCTHIIIKTGVNLNNVFSLDKLLITLVYRENCLNIYKILCLLEKCQRKYIG